MCVGSLYDDEESDNVGVLVFRADNSTNSQDHWDGDGRELWDTALGAGHEGGSDDDRLALEERLVSLDDDSDPDADYPVIHMNRHGMTICGTDLRELGKGGVYYRHRQVFSLPDTFLDMLAASVGLEIERDDGVFTISSVRDANLLHFHTSRNGQTLCGNSFRLRRSGRNQWDAELLDEILT